MPCSYQLWLFVGVEPSTHLNRNMNRHIPRNDLASTPLRYLFILLDKLGLARAFGERNDDRFLRFEHLTNGRILGLDENGDLVFEGLAVGREVVHARDGSSGTDGAVDEIEIGLGLGEVLFGDLRVSLISRTKGDLETYSFWEGRDHDGLAVIPSAPGETLPEVLGDVWHEGVKELETALETGVQGVLRGELGVRLLVGFKEGLCRFLYVSADCVAQL